jgi:nucleoside-diphosphate-sugar epimerase
MAKVLVTGAGGLLGTEFCRQLKAAEHDVWALDNQSRSTEIPECDTWIVTDLKNPDVFQNVLPNDFDYIYHYGAINGTTNFYERPNEVLVNNFVGDINVFEFASQCPNLKRIVYASSSEIVADDPVTPLTENLDITINNIHNARWSYRLAKITSENFLANSKLPYVMLRYFNVYGKNSKKGHFLGDQIDKIKNDVFTVIGAQETRSFCYITDAVSASIYVAEHANREVINIGNDREISIGDAVKIIAAEMGKPDAVFEQLPSKAGSVASRRPDITRLRGIMPDYEPTSFEEGIRQILS